MFVRYFANHLFSPARRVEIRSDINISEIRYKINPLCFAQQVLTLDILLLKLVVRRVRTNQWKYFFVFLSSNTYVYVNIRIPFKEYIIHILLVLSPLKYLYHSHVGHIKSIILYVEVRAIPRYKECDGYRMVVSDGRCYVYFENHLFRPP